MPNGGVHHCGYCRHLNRQTNICQLRKIFIEKILVTTCRDTNKETEEPH